MAAREPIYTITDLRPDRQGVDVRLGKVLVAYSSPANAGDDWAIYERPVGDGFWSETLVRSATEMMDHFTKKYRQKKAS